jgi:hypothetical protein
MPTDHQMLIVLNPGLLLLTDGMRQLVADIERMEADGMLKVSRFLQYVPGVLLPQETTGKPHEEDKRQLITDAGAPRSPLTARDGSHWTQVMPINDGVRLPLPDGCPHSEPERKPGVGVIVNEWQAYLACDKFKAFFNQFSLHTSEQSRLCLAFLQHNDI